MSNQSTVGRPLTSRPISFVPAVRGCDPSASMTMSWATVPTRGTDQYAIILPSRDHVGRTSTAGPEVSSRRPVPSWSTTTMSPPSSKAMRPGAASPNGGGTRRPIVKTATAAIRATSATSATVANVATARPPIRGDRRETAGRAGDQGQVTIRGARWGVVSRRSDSLAQSASTAPSSGSFRIVDQTIGSSGRGRRSVFIVLPPRVPAGRPCERNTGAISPSPWGSHRARRCR